MKMIDSYIICTSPRSGSTLLTRMLRDSGVAGWPGSHLHGASLTAWTEALDLAAPAEIGALELAQRCCAAARALGTRDGIFALRLQGHSLGTFRQALGLLHPGEPNDGARLQAELGRTRVIYLHRDDLVARAVSLLRAQQSGLWHMGADGTEIERLAPPARPVYDARAIAAQVAAFAAMDRAWNAWFAGQGISPLRLDYDALAADPNGTLVRVLSFLGLDPAAARGILPSTRQLRDDESAAWIQRFRTEGARPVS